MASLSFFNIHPGADLGGKPNVFIVDHQLEVTRPRYPHAMAEPAAASVRPFPTIDESACCRSSEHIASSFAEDAVLQRR